MENSWKLFLHEELNKPYFQQLIKMLDEEYRLFTIYPKREDIFKALSFFSISETKIIILGQDPYHGYNQAHGLAFSVNFGIPQPPSLKNIFKEMSNDLQCSLPTHGNLEKWAKQGVLLLNRILTVREATPLSHQNIGWLEFTKNIIITLNNDISPKAFVLWGNYSKDLKPLINQNKHCIIESTHPSPLSAHRGFFGSKPFSKANLFLKSNNRKIIDWPI